MHRCTISHIDPDSPLRHAAHPGDRLVSINGNPITDVLDYKYYAYDPELAVCLRRPDGTEHTVHVSKPLGGELGLDFETYLMDNAHSCANHCVFCFIDQMPPGMRPTLYFKDDDARLSFLMGNYMTLTNLSEREVQRIIHLHISPINVSVHATDPELRSFLLGNPRAGKTLEIMRRFSDGGITMNCQIVCCPGLNDGAQLQRTMHDLASLYPQVHSVSIVPVGLTKFREGSTRSRRSRPSTRQRRSIWSTPSATNALKNSARASSSVPTSCISKRGASCRRRNFMRNSRSSKTASACCVCSRRSFARR